MSSEEQVMANMEVRDPYVEGNRDATHSMFDEQEESGQSVAVEPSVVSEPITPILGRCSIDILAEPFQETKWLLEGILPAQAVVMLSGREGSMKTWLALDWARAVAEGAMWQNRSCEAGVILYLDGEMPGSAFRERLRVVGGSKNLIIDRWQDPDFPTRLDDPRLVAVAQTYQLIVVDTLRRFMGRRDENSATDMAEITGPLRELTRCGATVLALHHASKNPEKPGYRGSTELGAGVDIALTIEKQEQSGKERLNITATKTRYSQDPCVTLEVQRTPQRPEFTDVTATAPKAEHVNTADLEQLRSVIVDLAGKLGHNPSQSDIVEEAGERGLGSRGTILRRLYKGEGSHWKANHDGRSRVYELLSNCPPVQTPRGVENVDTWTDADMADEEVIQDET